MGVKRKPTARPAIELEIGQLVLDGVAPSDRHRVAAAVEHELGRLLAERGLPAGLGDGEPGSAVALRGVDGGSFEHRPGMAPRLVGARVAEGIYRGLGGGDGRGGRGGGGSGGGR